MNFLLDEGKFLTDVLKLIDFDKVSQTDRDFLEYLRVGVMTHYHQACDWELNPELARANVHHPKEKLQLSVLTMLIQLEALANKYGFNFVGATYLEIIVGMSKGLRKMNRLDQE